MAGMTWLHLSDWHQGSEAFAKYQKSEAFDRNKVRDELKEDILNRTSISSDLEKIDFIIFSGDVAFSGRAEEYEAALEQLFTPLLRATGLNRSPKRLFFVPGNHDLDREEINRLPEDIKQPYPTESQIKNWLTDNKSRNHLLQPFTAYTDFVRAFNGQQQPAYSCFSKFTINGKQVALLGLNSAFMCGRSKIIRDEKEEVYDYGHLVVGEPQLFGGWKQIADADVRIAVLHHPFGWLTDFERLNIREQLGKKFHFILCGHEHFPEVNMIEGTMGHCLMIPAAAGFEKRVPDNPIYSNAYNFAHLDFDTGQVTVYLRCWNSRQSKFEKDTSVFSEGQKSFPLSKLLNPPAHLLEKPEKKSEDKQTFPASPEQPQQGPNPASKPPVSQPPPSQPIPPLQRNKAPINDRNKLLALLSNCSTRTFSRTALLIDAPVRSLFGDRDTRAERASKLIEWAEHSGGRGFSALYMAYLREALEKTRDEHFGKGDLIFKDQCDPAIETLKNLSKLVQKLLENDNAHGYPLTVPLNDVANQISGLKTLLDIFHDQCPPPRLKNADEKDYHKNREELNNQMKSLGTALDSLLSKLKKVTNM